MEQQHTFGGLGLMGRLVDFETDAGAGDGGGAPAFPAPDIPAADDSLLADDGAALFDGGADDELEPQAADPAPAEPPAWAGPPQEEWQQVTQFLGELRQYLEEDGQQQQQQPAAPEPVDYSQFDPNDPEQMQQMIDTRAQQLLEERLGPYQPILDQQAQQQGEQMVKEELDKIAGELGDFDRGQALLLTNSLLANGVPAAQAFRQAASIRIADEKAMRESAVADYLKSLKEAGEAPAEPAAGGAARLDEAPKYDGRDPDRYEKAAEDFMARRRGQTLAT